MTAAQPFSHLHRESAAEGEEASGPTPSPSESKTEELRAQISAEIQEQMALERFQSEHPDLWMQVNRLGRLMNLQDECDDETFPPGSCFLYANVPGFQCFAVKKVLGVDLDTCQASIDIYGDGELEEGTIVLPLEVISWYGFPKDAIPLSFPYSGFTTNRPLDGGPPPSAPRITSPKP